MTPLSLDLRDKLLCAPVAGLSAQLRKRWLDNVTIDGVRPLVPGRKLVGTARTLRFVPNREDLFASRLSPAHRKAAHIHDVAPADFTTRQVPYVGEIELPDHVDLGIETYGITDDDRWALRFERSAPTGLNGAEMSVDDLALAHANPYAGSPMERRADTRLGTSARLVTRSARIPRAAGRGCCGVARERRVSVVRP